MRFNHKFWGLGFVLGLLITNQVWADDLQTKLEKIERDLLVLQRQVYRFNVADGQPEIKEAASSSEVPKAYSDYLVSRMDLIDEALSMLTNQVEELQFKNQNLTERLERIVKDLEFRLYEIENQKKETSKEPIAVKKEEPVSNKTPLNNTQEPEKIYNQAYNELKKANYVKAEEYLILFMNDFSEHELAGNAQYWLGETYYVRGDFEKSAVAFAKCYEQYGKGNKGADCLLKLGLSMASLGNTAEACVAFKSLDQEYPKALEPIKKRNSAEINRLNCK